MQDDHIDTARRLSFAVNCPWMAKKHININLYLHLTGKDDKMLSICGNCTETYSMLFTFYKCLQIFPLIVQHNNTCNNKHSTA